MLSVLIKTTRGRASKSQLLAQIYSEAANVRIWLGKDEENKSGIAMDFIIRIIDFENFDRLIADERMVKEWAALLSLMKRTWLGVSSIYHPPPAPFSLHIYPSLINLRC
jgi:hypothetical protein